MNGELRACKKSGNGSADQDCSQCPIDEEEDFIGLLPKEIIRFRAEFIRNRLDDKAEEYCDPYPVGASEACRIKQREGGKKSSAERLPV